MRQYDKWDRYPYNNYGNAVVVDHHIEHSWMEENLIKEDWWKTSEITGETYKQGEIVFYQGWWTEEDSVIYSFKNPENKQRVISLLPDILVEADPFGPDRCPGCGGPTEPMKTLVQPRKRGLSWWSRLLNK